MSISVVAVVESSITLCCLILVFMTRIGYISLLALEGYKYTPSVLFANTKSTLSLLCLLSQRLKGNYNSESTMADD
jgi:hypothetical protein